jgi:hypothetical protein
MKTGSAAALIGYFENQASHHVAMTRSMGSSTGTAAAAHLRLRKYQTWHRKSETECSRADRPDQVDWTPSSRLSKHDFLLTRQVFLLKAEARFLPQGFLILR